MKKITLTKNNTFEHLWLPSLHQDIPDHAINVTDHVFMILSQDKSKKYDHGTKTISDYVLPFDFSNAINDKLTEINSESSTALAVITDDYTREEMDSWPTQEAEAKAWNNNNTESTPFLDSIVANRTGMDKSTLVNKVLANAVTFKIFSGAVIGKKQGFIDALNALPETATQADIDAIMVVY